MSAAEGSAAGPERGLRRRRRGVIALGLVLALAFGLRAALPFAIARGAEWQVPKLVGLPLRIENVDLWLLRGSLSVEGLVLGRRVDAPNAAPDPETALLRWQRLFVDLAWRDLLARRVHVQTLLLDGPAVRVEREADGRIDPLGSSARPPAPAPEPVAAEPAEPWRLSLDRLELRRAELRLVDAAAQATPLELSLGGLVVSELSFVTGALGVGGVTIRSPALRVERELLFGAPGAAPQEEPASAPESTDVALAYRIERIGIDDASFRLHTASGPLEVGLRLSAERVDAGGGVLFPIDLELRLGEGTLALEGRLGLDPPAYQGRLAYRDLPLPPLTLAARPELAAWVRSCRASGDLEVELRLARVGEAPAGLLLSGTASVRDLSIADPQDPELALGWKELEVVAREVFVPLPEPGEPPGAPRAALERVRLVEPDVRYKRPAPSLEALLAGGDAPAAAADPAVPSEPEEPAAAFDLSLDTLEVAGGRLRFRDATVSPTYEARVRDLAVAVRALGFPGFRAQQLRVSGIVPDAASFSLEGGIEPGAGELRFELTRLSLPPFDPYLAGAGYRVERGDASLASALRVRGARYEAENRLVLHELDVSAQDEGEFQGQFGVPIDLALALLRDPQGDIELPIPVVVDESGAGVGTGAIVRGALRQALLGALASPLKLVGAVLPRAGGGTPSLTPLEAVAGSDALAPAAAARLEPLAGLLASRPALGLLLHGRVGPEDRPRVAEQILVERALADEELPAVEEAGLLARRRITQALRARGRGERAELSPEDEALLGRYVAALPVPPERLAALARGRAESVRGALVSAHAIDPQRLAVAEAGEEGAPAVLLELVAAPL